ARQRPPAPRHAVGAATGSEAASGNGARTQPRKRKVAANPLATTTADRARPRARGTRARQTE
ncbi:MAG TPA: hypothetical protein VGN32_00840, partial [Ktedonobacterales bacterium]|nr:hypothetical protein [Ktedonobacterales bacterium]